MKLNPFLLSLATSALAANSYGVLEFANLGFDGYYREVASISNAETDECTCSLSTDKTSFSGTNAPLNEPLSVHFRGPLILNSFGYYVTDSYNKGDSSGEWTRLAYYNASSSTADNVTFLTNAGANSTCLGKALTYADSDGVSSASSSTVLKEGTKIISNEEYAIFSGEECDSSGSSKNCGVYRDGIAAYQGFGGAVKMFLFDFEMPTESSADESVAYYDMPAIWLLNAKIPRTSQYPDNGNCSCWNSGCGEFDIFEVMNTTETGHLYSTVHDYQGTDDIENGLQVGGYIERDTSGPMRGGVVFGSDGNAVVFMTNDTTISSNISSSDVSNWISSAGSTLTDTLSSVSAAAETGSSSSKKSSAAGVINQASIFTNIMVSIFGIVFYALA